jgi:hypothetical protein
MKSRLISLEGHAHQNQAQLLTPLAHHSQQQQAQQQQQPQPQQPHQQIASQDLTFPAKPGAAACASIEPAASFLLPAAALHMTANHDEGAGVQVTRQSTGVKAEQGAVRGKAEEVVALQEKVATLARHVDVYSRQVQDSFPYVHGAERHWSDQLGNDRSAPCGVGTGAVRIRSNIRLWEVARAGANWGAAWRSVVGCRRRRGIEGRGGQRMRRTTLGALSPRRMGLCRALLD